ncbi:unnamed protein product [Musa textilis]
MHRSAHHPPATHQPPSRRKSSHPAGQSCTAAAAPSPARKPPLLFKKAEISAQPLISQASSAQPVPVCRHFSVPEEEQRGRSRGSVLVAAASPDRSCTVPRAGRQPPPSRPVAEEQKALFVREAVSSVPRA